VGHYAAALSGWPLTRCSGLEGASAEPGRGGTEPFPCGGPLVLGLGGACPSEAQSQGLSALRGSVCRRRWRRISARRLDMEQGEASWPPRHV